MVEIVGLKIRNRHPSKQPPVWIEAEGEQGRRFYFENNYGDQWFALIHGQTLRVTGGDVDWQTYAFSADPARTANPEEKPLADLAMTPAEQHWIAALVLVLCDEIVDEEIRAELLEQVRDNAVLH